VVSSENGWGTTPFYHRILRSTPILYNPSLPATDNPN